ncbi:hypothetical protein EYR41_002857 [Orbilia oligospora]|uniref:Uncharacterized protein n=1 Tax=Orbilia oligospora TaxID=2813651 RepID=A0A8H2E4U1_ORBOL|nr:hypothetical protein EYR41_002857 [Orbilia oligospora]
MVKILNSLFDDTDMLDMNCNFRDPYGRINYVNGKGKQCQWSNRSWKALSRSLVYLASVIIAVLAEVETKAASEHAHHASPKFFAISECKWHRGMQMSIDEI